MVACHLTRRAPLLSAIFLILTAICIPLKAAEPAAKIQPYPSKAELERYEDNEDMFASLLLDYYRTASILEAQLKFWSVKPIVVVPGPTLDEITDQDTKTLKKFHGIATKLQTQIEALPEDELRAHLRDVEERLKAERKNAAELQVKNFELDLKSQHAESYSMRIYDIVRRCDSMKNSLDSISYLYYLLKFSSNSALAKALDDAFIPSLMLSNSAHIIGIGVDGVRSDISYGAKAELNLNSIFNFGKYLDIWFAYLMPQIKSNSFPDANGSLWREWNSNIYSFGANLNFPEIIELSPAKAGIKIGGGYYWGGATSPNFDFPKTEYKGETLNLELNFSKLTTISPASLYFNFGVLFPSREIIYFDPVRPTNIGKTAITTFGLGLRFNVL